MKSIIAFYTKAKAHLQLSDFYDACAQVWRGGTGQLERTQRVCGSLFCCCPWVLNFLHSWKKNRVKQMERHSDAVFAMFPYQLKNSEYRVHEVRIDHIEIVRSATSRERHEGALAEATR